MLPNRSLLLAALFTLVSPAAFAHAHLAGASTAADGLKLVFSEGVEAAFSSVAVADSQGRAVPMNAATTAAGDKKVLLVNPTSPLPPGEYTGTWKVTSVDTHQSAGEFHFKVGP